MPAREPGPLSNSALPSGIRARIIEGVGDLNMHILEAGDDSEQRPTILLLHGFPELAFCWRRLMPILADRGYHVVAPDQRGFGRTSPQPSEYHTDLEPYSTGNLAADIINLIDALKLSSVEAIAGHDMGSIVAGYCALARPDLFCHLVLMASPFSGAPAVGASPPSPFITHPVHEDLARLAPPRKHYQVYYSGPQANEDMWQSPQGMHQFLRGYYHQKSADWTGNKPRPLSAWTAEELEHMPHYYCMPLERNMADVADAFMPNPGETASCAWLTDADLAVAAAEFERTGFQPALNWYRSAVVEGMTYRDLARFAGRRVDMPTIYVTGDADWGAYQAPGLLEAMRDGLASEPVPIHFVEGAGHWIQQEKPEQLGEIILNALDVAGGLARIKHPALQ